MVHPKYLRLAGYVWELGGLVGRFPLVGAKEGAMVKYPSVWKYCWLKKTDPNHRNAPTTFGRSKEKEEAGC